MKWFKKYRMVKYPYDGCFVDHVWIVEKRRFLFFWFMEEFFRTKKEAEEYIRKQKTIKW